MNVDGYPAEDLERYAVFWSPAYHELFQGIAAYYQIIERRREVARFGFRGYNKGFSFRRGGMFDVGNQLPVIDVNFVEVSGLDDEFDRLRALRVGTSIVLRTPGERE